jgi:hypothetical protein
MAINNSKKTIKLGVALLTLAAVAAVAALALAGRSNGTPSPNAAPAQQAGIDATTLGQSFHPVALKVRSLALLPAQAHVPAKVASFVGHIGRLTHSAPVDVNSVRLLRSNLGAGDGAVYGVTSAAGSPCFMLTSYGGTCAGGPNTARSGVAWIIGGAHDGLPGVFVGLAADDVTSVHLNIDGTSVPLTIQSNVAFAQLPARAHDAIITTIRAGGRTSSEGLSLIG